MESMRKRNWLGAICAMLAVLLLSLAVFNFAQSEQLEQAQTRINAVYQKAFYETCELTEAISANYRKLLVAGDPSQMQVLLGDISRETQGASGNLALLPLGEETVSATIKFINQAEDFAETLSQKLAAGEAVSDADYQTMVTLSDSAARFTLGLEELLNRYERGEAVFSADDFTETGDESLYPLTGDAAEYPVLLYDGPFSDGATVGDFEYLSAMEEVTREQAEAKLRAFVPVEELTYLGESHPEVDCYDFRIVSGGYSMSASVTKLGGEVLYLLPDSQETQINLSEAELCDRARAFLISRGYGAMEMSYYSRYGGILTINYAAVQDGVTLYPDLIKIQMSMKDGSVIGLDAKSYLKNHTQRTLAQPVLSEAEALDRVSPKLTAISARLCVIPQNRAEYLCYEISAANADGDFLVYVDARTGVERELMQVISKSNGTLVM